VHVPLDQPLAFEALEGFADRALTGAELLRQFQFDQFVARMVTAEDDIGA
jgi:hypothetical protein